MYRPMWSALIGLLRSAIAHEDAARHLREPIAADIDSLVAWYAPTLQRYLTGPLLSGRRADIHKEVVA